MSDETTTLERIGVLIPILKVPEYVKTEYGISVHISTIRRWVKDGDIEIAAISKRRGRPQYVKRSSVDEMFGGKDD